LADFASKPNGAIRSANSRSLPALWLATTIFCPLSECDGDAEYYRGEVEGTLVWPPRGTLGFGYDPVFLPNGFDKTFGEMSAGEKHGWKPGQATALSHRARAFQKFAQARLDLARLDLARPGSA